jgi:flagellar biosynthesis protein FlhF
MKIKKFRGSSMSECLLQVKKELGENAVILDSRKVTRGGALSFLMQDTIEVTASTADPHLDRKATRRWSDAGGDGQESQGNPVKPFRPTADLLTDQRPFALAASNQRQGGGYAAGSGETATWDESRGLENLEYGELSDEIRGLKETVFRMADHLKFSQLPNLPAELEHLHRQLLENGVDDRIASTITQEITLELSGVEFEDHKLVHRVLREKIAKVVKVAPRLQPVNKPWVIALIGPTGVGKTTTLAKMATHPNLFGRKRVALVSVDTYRIAAVEQLKTFASIAGIPMEAVYRPTDVRRAIDHFHDRDIVLIDTAGRSQNHQGQLSDLAAFMEYARPDEINLVLSVTTRLEDQLDVIRKFKKVGPQRIVFTKLDETSTYGQILNICYHEQKPVTLLTCGQNVPDDVISPDQKELVSLVSDRGFYQKIVVRSQESGVVTR